VTWCGEGDGMKMLRPLRQLVLKSEAREGRTRRCVLGAPLGLHVRVESGQWEPPPSTVPAFCSRIPVSSFPFPLEPPQPCEHHRPSFLAIAELKAQHFSHRDQQVTAVARSVTCCAIDRVSLKLAQVVNDHFTASERCYQMRLTALGRVALQQLVRQ
jgi:hypothetical protein